MSKESLTFNYWADFWRNECGLNVIPADTKNKKIYEKWSLWQNERISEGQHEEWKRKRKFDSGMAIMAGNIWHKKDLEEYSLCFIDLDNQKAIEEICVIFGTKDLNQLAQRTIVEQHRDNPFKAHIYFYTEYILKKKSSDTTRKLKDKLDSNEIPAIEVKCQSDGLAYCTPSLHKDGYNYEITGTNVIGKFDGKKIEDRLFDVYEKYEISVGNGNNENKGKIPIEDLFNPEFIVKEGHNRHEAVLRVIDSLYLRNKESKSLEYIYEESWNWNLNHCDPPISKSDFDRQWKDGTKFVDRTNSGKNQETVLLQRQSQQNQQLKIDPQIICKIVSCINNIPKAYYIDENSGQVCYGVLKEYGINLEKCIIDIAPKKIRYYNNPLFPIAEPKVELEYYDGKKGGKIGPYASLTELLKILEIKGYVLNRNKAADAFNSVVSAMREKENDMVEYVNDVTTLGYYLVDGKLVAKSITQNMEEIKKEEVIECCELLDILATGWKNKDVFPTVLKWGLLAPYSFIIKSNSDKWMPYLQMFGQGQSGKTTLGLLVLQIWNRSTMLKKGFNNIDTPARFGETVSKDTYPILVNEVGSLYETGKFRRYTNIIEMIKHSVESTTARAKFVEQNNFQDIPALSPLILTSNYAPPNDGGFGRRFVSIHFPKDEKKEDDKRALFDKLLEDKKGYLKILGDFTAQYVSKDPSTLLKEDWKVISKEILANFYQFADKEVPDWIEYFVEQRDAVDESNENTMFALRSFLITKINETYSRHKDKDNTANRLSERLDYCLKNELIPFIHDMKGDIIITHDILDEINNRNRIENITSLKDIGLQLGLEYKSKYLNNKKMRVLCGPLDKLLKFINPDIFSEH